MFLGTPRACCRRPDCAVSSLSAAASLALTRAGNDVGNMWIIFYSFLADRVSFLGDTLLEEDTPLEDDTLLEANCL